MRYLMMIKASKESEAGILPSQQFMAEMGKLTEEMMKAGVVLLTGGLQPSALGARIQYSGGKSTVIDGPFVEAKELIGGFAIVEAKSKEEAIALANRVVELHIQAGVDGEMEIRPLYESPDSGLRQA